MKIVIATIKNWNIKKAQDLSLRYDCLLITNKDELTEERLRLYNPDYVFFPHWSWMIPEEIYSNFNCIVFHMTDLPFGRGGSPLQNLIIRGIKHTKISAIKVEKGVDTGPVYMKRDLCIEGTAEEVFRRASSVVFSLIEEIIQSKPTPIPQTGEVVNFQRRTPIESQLPITGSIEDILSFIQMLDGEGYPPAFVDYGDFRISFSRAVLYDGRIVADVTISPIRGDKNE